MKKAEILEMLDGCEVQSLSQEGVVYCLKGVLYQDGDVLDLTEKEIKKLWREYVKQELAEFY